METMDRKDLSRESIREKLKRISKPDTTWIKKARKRAGLPEEGDKAFTDEYVLWLEDKLISKNERR